MALSEWSHFSLPPGAEPFCGVRPMRQHSVESCQKAGKFELLSKPRPSFFLSDVAFDWHKRESG